MLLSLVSPGCCTRSCPRRSHTDRGLRCIAMCGRYYRMQTIRGSSKVFRCDLALKGITLTSPNPLEYILQQSSWYAVRSRYNRSIYISLKSIQIVCAAAIPVVSVAAPSNTQRWTTAGLGALVGILEAITQLGQYQQNWLLYRATRESLRREQLLRSAGVGPYAGVTNSDAIYIERCDAVMSGEHSKWLTSQQQADSGKQSGKH